MIRSLIKLLATFFILIIIAAFSVALFFESQVEEFFIKKINAYLSTELLIKDDIQFSLLSNFPYASLTLNNVALRENLKGSKRNLLEADQMAFLFNWADVFGSEYKIHTLVIRNGKLYLRSLHGGTVNYDVVATDESANSSDDDFLFSLEQAELQNILVHYFDEPLEQETTLLLEDGLLSGTFGAETYEMSLNANLLCQQFYVGDIDYFPDKKAYLDLKLKIDFDKALYTFANSSLQLEDNQFEIDGTAQLKDTYSVYDLHLKGIDLSLSECLQLLPPDYTQNLQGLDSRGELVFDATIKGKQTDYELPAINVNFHLDNGKITHDQLDNAIKKLNIKGNFNNGKKKTRQSATFTLNTLSATIDGEPINAQALISNLDKPQIDLLLNGKIPLETFRSMADEYGLNRLDGHLIFDQIQIKGMLNELSNNSSSNYPEVKGILRIEDLIFKKNGQWIESFNSNIRLLNNDLILAKSELNVNKTQARMSGKILGGTALLAHHMLNDSIPPKQAALLDLNLIAERIDLEELLSFIPEENKADSVHIDENIEAITSNQQAYIKGNITVKVDQLTNKRLEAEDLRGELTIQNNAFIIDQLLVDLFGGQLELRGDFKISPKRNLYAKTFIRGKDINMSRLLYEMNNFGQEYLTNEQLSGTLETQVFLKMYFDKFLNFDYTKFRMIADLGLDDGIIEDFTPMLALSKFVKVSELNKVRFSRLENQIEIANQKLRIPAMFINSNVVRLTFSGIHTFANRIQYYVRLNLMDILMGKFKKKNRDIDAKANKKGGINVHLTLMGDAFDPDIKYMKKKIVKQKFEQDEQRKKHDLNKILEQEFRLGRGIVPALDNLKIELDKAITP